MILRRKVGQGVRWLSVQSACKWDTGIASSSKLPRHASYCHCSPSRQARPIAGANCRQSTNPRMMSTQEIKESPIPIFNNIADFRRWRKTARAKGKSVGFVPTMGALHDGHLGLVRQSLQENDETVVSIFVNPAQFAPSEDLSSYPRTMSNDLKALSSISSAKSVSAIFAPTIPEMYPSPDGKPFTQHVKDQVGAFVEIQGLQHQMEGASRPTFFRGVATVCTKLFHIVEPDLAYFGQKDIQQAIILRRLVSDLLFSYPPSAQAVRVLKTIRDNVDGLALSSRNAYLTPQSRVHANILYTALCAGRDVWEGNRSSSSSSSSSSSTFSSSSSLLSSSQLIKKTLSAANQTANKAIKSAEQDNVSIEILYISLNDPITLQDLSQNPPDSINNGAIFSAAALIKQGQQGRVTRLIDNFLLGFSLE